MKINDLPPDNIGTIHQVAKLLFDGFRTHWPDAWARFGFSPERNPRVFRVR